MENYLRDGSNVISMNFMNTIIANAMQSSKLGEVEVFENPFATNDYIFETSPPSEVFENPFVTDDYNDCDIFTPPTIEDIVYVDYDMPPIYDVYNDGCDCFAPTITNDNGYIYVESNDTFMRVNHDNNAL